MNENGLKYFREEQSKHIGAEYIKKNGVEREYQIRLVKAECIGARKLYQSKRHRTKIAE